MSSLDATQRLSDATDRVRATAKRIRASAHDLLDRGEPADDPDAAVRAADTLAALSRRLEEVAEGAHSAGMAVRDRGRDGARALERGERTLREGGLLAGAARAAFIAKRNVGVLALGGAAVAALVMVARRAD